MKKKGTYYIAYGSNLNIRQMRHRCPGAVPVGVGYLKGWELFYAGSKTGNYATIRKKKGKIVPVGVWKVSDDNIEALDRYEGYPGFYYKDHLLVHMVTQEHDLRGLVYIMNPLAKAGIPSPGYVAVCREGYRDFGIAERLLDESLQAAGFKYPDSISWDMW